MSKTTTDTSSGGIGFIGMLTILFIGLKLTDNIDWSWWWVLSPIWITVLRRAKERVTPGERDTAWLAARMPNATENQIEWFCERVAMILQDELQAENDARVDVLEGLCVKKPG